MERGGGEGGGGEKRERGGEECIKQPLREVGGKLPVMGRD